VLRGGAFRSDAWDAGCAYRYRGDPDVRLVSYGFRVVVSPLGFL
jgi:formylglycine-generating enzyme required for sulfatase activity